MAQHRLQWRHFVNAVLNVVLLKKKKQKIIKDCDFLCGKTSVIYFDIFYTFRARLYNEGNKYIVK
jgi:hypothetical protein